MIHEEFKPLWHSLDDPACMALDCPLQVPNLIPVWIVMEKRGRFAKLLFGRSYFSRCRRLKTCYEFISFGSLVYRNIKLSMYVIFRLLSACERIQAAQIIGSSYQLCEFMLLPNLRRIKVLSEKKCFPGDIEKHDHSARINWLRIQLSRVTTVCFSTYNGDLNQIISWFMLEFYDGPASSVKVFCCQNKTLFMSTPAVYFQVKVVEHNLKPLSTRGSPLFTAFILCGLAQSCCCISYKLCLWNNFPWTIKHTHLFSGLRNNWHSIGSSEQVSFLHYKHVELWCINLTLNKQIGRNVGWSNLHLTWQLRSYRKALSGMRYRLINLVWDSKQKEHRKEICKSWIPAHESINLVLDVVAGAHGSAGMEALRGGKVQVYFSRSSSRGFIIKNQGWLSWSSMQARAIVLLNSRYPGCRLCS